MEAVLVSVTIFSLLLAVAMSIVAWALLRQERARAAARIEALAASAADPAPAPVTLLLHAPAAPSAADADWDLPLRVRRAAGVDEPSRASRSERPAAAMPLFAPPAASNAAGRRWLVLAAIALIVGAGVAAVSALRSPEIVAAVAASNAEKTRSGGNPASLELLSLRHTVDPDGAFTVVGLVQNPAEGKNQSAVEAIVYLFDDGGRYFANGRAALETSALQPGNESPFVVRIANGTGVTRFRVGFRTKDGAVITHVDRRGELSGDLVSATAVVPVPLTPLPLDAVVPEAGNR